MTDRLEVICHDQTVGRLGLADNGCCVFQYSPSWLADGFSISPLELPLKNEVFIARPTPFGGGFGVFDDSLPDGWGMLVLDRFLASRGVDLRRLDILDRLSIVGANGRGALEYRPVHELDPGHIHFADFDSLAEEAAKILNNDDYQGAGIEEFLRRGGSPGGARPKIFTRHEGREWMVKFPAREDPSDIGRREYEYSLLAKESGVEMPETRLFEGKYFATERFDRLNGEKVHTVSVAGLLRADYRSPSIDYSHIFALTACLTRSTAELWKLYRLMVFNYLIGNRDDHAKNFAFLYKEGVWRLSPAYDLLPSHGFNGYHTTTINDAITPVDEDLIAVAAASGLDAAKARHLLASMKALISES